MHEKAHPLEIQISFNAPDLSSILQAPERPFPLASSPGSLEGVSYFKSTLFTHEAFIPPLALACTRIKYVIHVLLIIWYLLSNWVCIFHHLTYQVLVPSLHRKGR